MSIHSHASVNALRNPAMAGDLIIAESGERYLVCQTMRGEYWLKHAKSGQDLTHPVSGQIELVRQIADLANL